MAIHSNSQNSVFPISRQVEKEKDDNNSPIPNNFAQQK